MAFGEQPAGSGVALLFAGSLQLEPKAALEGVALESLAPAPLVNPVESEPRHRDRGDAGEDQPVEGLGIQRHRHAFSAGHSASVNERVSGRRSSDLTIPNTASTCFE